MKNPVSSLLACAVLLCLPNFLTSQNPISTPLPTDTTHSDTSDYSDNECGGYAPYASYHVVTDVDGLRLRERPSLDAPVLATLPKNTRLIWHGGNCSEEFEVTFNDGIARKGRWVNVSVWKGGGQSGWVFDGAVTLTYVLYDAEFGGGLECLGKKFFDLHPIDSLEFARRFVLSASKREKMGQSVLYSTDGQYGLRQLQAKQDRMAGLEFIFRQTGHVPSKVTLEMVYGNKLRRIAWAKEPGRILIEWEDEEGIIYYDMGMPQTKP